MLAKRGIEVHASTICRWVQRYALQPAKRSAWGRSRLSSSWRVEETYGRARGCWKHLYRAIDKNGATLDCMLTDRRNTKAAKRFLGAALERS